MTEIALPDTPTYGVLSTAEANAGLVLNTNVPDGTLLVNPTTEKVYPVNGTLNNLALSTPSTLAAQQVR